MIADSLDEELFARLIRRMDPESALRRAWRLTGGVSAHVTAVEVKRADGDVQTLLVRRHGEVDLRQNPNIARDEFKLLEIAKSHGLAVPQPHYLDESGDLFPTPYLVIEYIEGETDFEPADVDEYVRQMAEELAKIHRIGALPELSFLPEQGQGFGERPAILDDSMDEGRIRDALELAWPLSDMNAFTLLHGDFWPGNILWREGKLAAVIDWEDARTGDPLADLANTRLEILFALGAEAMDDFTDRYLSLTGVDSINLPYWDLCAALRPCSKFSGWGLDADTEARMRERHRSFAERAIVDCFR